MLHRAAIPSDRQVANRPPNPTIFPASVVVLFFMHLKYTPGMTRIALAAAVGWLAILLVLTFADLHTRNWTPVPQSWQASAATPGQAP